MKYAIKRVMTNEGFERVEQVSGVAVRTQLDPVTQYYVDRITWTSELGEATLFEHSAAQAHRDLLPDDTEGDPEVTRIFLITVMPEDKAANTAPSENILEAEMRVALAVRAEIDVHLEYFQTLRALDELAIVGIVKVEEANTGLGNDDTYQLTERGHRWVQMLVHTPYPEHVWTDPRTKQAIE